MVRQEQDPIAVHYQAELSRLEKERRQSFWILGIGAACFGLWLVDTQAFQRFAITLPFAAMVFGGTFLLSVRQERERVLRNLKDHETRRAVR